MSSVLIFGLPISIGGSTRIDFVVFDVVRIGGHVCTVLK